MAIRGSTAPASDDTGSGASPFGVLLLRLRLEAQLSQEALAERARMSVDAISALERGTRRRPRFDTVALLAAALRLDDGARRAFEAAARPPFPANTAAAVPQAAHAPANNNLPVSLSSFVGREIELGEILGFVRGRRLVTLTGTGGIGKTRTAV